MSRTYRKRIIKTTAGGNNTSFYRLRRRKIKNAGRMQLRHLLANFNIDDVSNLWEEPNIPMRNEWAEPTDGHYGITKRDYKKLKSESSSELEYVEFRQDKRLIKK